MPFSIRNITDEFRSLSNGDIVVYKGLTYMLTSKGFLKVGLEKKMNALQQLIKQTKEKYFLKPSKATDEEVLGVIISQHLKWNGEKIVNTFSNALEDANFHSFNELMLDCWDNTEKRKKIGDYK